MIEPTKNIKKMYEQNIIEYDQHVEQIFIVNISYLYRLLRAHQKIKYFVKLANFDEEDSEPEEKRKKVEEESVTPE